MLDPSSWLLFSFSAVCGLLLHVLRPSNNAVMDGLEVELPAFLLKLL
jgi:hypothetical protein